MLVNRFLPHIIPATTDFKLSFLKMTSEECLATSDPSSFNVNPTSAFKSDFVSAGEIPVTPTTNCSFLSPVTSRCLSSEEAHDKTFKS